LDFRKYLREFGRQDNPPKIPGNLVFDRSVPVEGAADALSEVGIDLSPFMDGDFGHFIVVVKPPKEFLKEFEYWRTVQAWVQVTQIGLDAFADHSDMVAWTTRLKTEHP
jgi:alpha-2-macroglobulin